MTIKNPNDAIGNGTRDIPSCSIVPEPTAPPQVPPTSHNLNNLERRQIIHTILDVGLVNLAMLVKQHWIGLLCPNTGSDYCVQTLDRTIVSKHLYIILTFLKYKHIMERCCVLCVMPSLYSLPNLTCLRTKLFNYSGLEERIYSIVLTCTMLQPSGLLLKYVLLIWLYNSL